MCHCVFIDISNKNCVNFYLFTFLCGTNRDKQCPGDLLHNWRVLFHKIISPGGRPAI